MLNLFLVVKTFVLLIFGSTSTSSYGQSIVDCSLSAPATSSYGQNVEVRLDIPFEADSIYWGNDEEEWETTKTLHEFRGGFLGRNTWTAQASNSETGEEAFCSASTLIHRKPLDQSPVSSTSMLIEGSRLFVSNPDNNSLTSFDLRTSRKIFEVPVCKTPRDISFHSGLVWLVCEGDDNLLSVTPKDGLIKNRLFLGKGSAPRALLSVEKNLIVGEFGTGNITIVDPSSLKIIQRVVASPTLAAMAWLPATRTLYSTQMISKGNQASIWEWKEGKKKAKELTLQIETTTEDSEDAGRGLPNYLTHLAVSPDGQELWVSAKKDNIQRGLVRDGQPLNFENSVRAIVARVPISKPAWQSAEEIGKRVDFNDREGTSAIVFSALGHIAFVGFRGSDLVEIVDAYSGEILTTIEEAGSAPDQLWLSKDDSLLYVRSFLSREVKAYDVRSLIEEGEADIQLRRSFHTVKEEIMSPEVLAGKKVFYFAGDARMSQDGYISCASCHLDGGHDGQTWDFTDRGEGLRNTTTLLGKSGTGHGRMHWTGNFDEVQDFENDIRGAFGGSGFLTDEEFARTGASLGERKTGLSKELDAMAAYVSSLDETPESPMALAEDMRKKGLELMEKGDCLRCHQGSTSTDSQVDAMVLYNVGTLKSTSGSRLGSELLGLDTPTLKGIWATGPYLHDGSQGSILGVLKNAKQTGLHGTLDQFDSSELETLSQYILSL